MVDTLKTIDMVGPDRSNKQRCWKFMPLNFPNYTFSFGKSYLLDGWPWHGGDTLSWIIGGLLDKSSGHLLKNDSPYPLEQRQQEAWCVRSKPLKIHRFSFREPTIEQQVKHGLETGKNNLLRSEAEVIEQFHLTHERYRNRTLRQLSNEFWRSSCAIGFVNGRRIFCFPYVIPDIVNMNAKPYFIDMFKYLTQAGALILFPTSSAGIMHPESLCDEIVPVTHNLRYGIPQYYDDTLQPDFE